MAGKGRLRVLHPLIRRSSRRHVGQDTVGWQVSARVTLTVPNEQALRMAKDPEACKQVLKMFGIDCEKIEIEGHERLVGTEHKEIRPALARLSLEAMHYAKTLKGRVFLEDAIKDANAALERIES